MSDILSAEEWNTDMARIAFQGDEEAADRVRAHDEALRVSRQELLDALVQAMNVIANDWESDEYMAEWGDLVERETNRG